MTRMWGVEPSLLCDQHLLGEHNEMHQEIGTIRNHPHGQAVVEGHAERQQVDTSKLQERHDELVVEMERRGIKHESPSDYSDDLDLGTIDIEANQQDLKDRCRDCRKRFQEKNMKTAEGGN